MTPTYLHSVALPSIPLEHSEVQTHQVLISSPSQASSSCSFSSPSYFNLNQDHGLNYAEDQGQLRASKDGLNGGSSEENEFIIPSYPSVPSMKKNINYGLKLSMIWKHDHDQDKEGANPNDIGSPNGSTTSAKWMSSKMRLMKRMMNSSRPVENPNLDKNYCSNNNSTNSSNGNNNIRVCSDCNTTKTPLWRSGPRGPKSLCNACGIRQRKARRAMAAAAISSALHHPNETSQGKVIMNHHKKEKRSSGKGYNISHHYKKQRCKLAGTSPSSGKKLSSCFEDFTISLSKNSAFHRVFPQDEKEAAILLMALSYGLVLHR